jgi:hypothetical protein
MDIKEEKGLLDSWDASSSFNNTAALSSKIPVSPYTSRHANSDCPRKSIIGNW